MISACGGPSAASGVCRLAKSRLSEIQDPNTVSDAYLPADVIADLEAYCGRPIYSTALAEATPAAAGDDVVEEACALGEEALAAQRLVRLNAAKGFKPANLPEIFADLDLIEGHVRAVRAIVGRRP